MLYAILRLIQILYNYWPFFSGTGASCIYPLLGATRFGWKFLASDIDKSSIEIAKANADKNKLCGSIYLQHINEVTHLLYINIYGYTLDFKMLYLWSILFTNSSSFQDESFFNLINEECVKKFLEDKKKSDDTSLANHLECISFYEKRGNIYGLGWCQHGWFSSFSIISKLNIF